MEAKSFNDLLKKSQKKYGEELIRIGNDNVISGIEWWELDSPKIADLLGKGLPKGRMIEVYGEESTGKTSLCYYFSGQVQKQGGNIVYIDTENAVDPEYASQMGLDLEKALIVQPDYGEQALDIAIDMIESNQVDLIIIDSVAALVPKAELEGEMTDMTIGLMARTNSKFCRKVASILNKAKCSIIFVNQTRDKIGVLYGNPTTTSGGKAIKFASSIRLQTYKKETLIGSDKRPYGNICRLKTVKNKVACPYRDTEVTLLYGKGYDVEGEWIDFAVLHNVIQKSGGWFQVPNVEKRIQGLHNVKAYLEENPEEYEEIKKKVKKLMNRTIHEEDEEIKENAKDEEVEESLEEINNNKEIKNEENV